VSRIARYAAGYERVAQIQASFRQILALHGIDPSLPTFEADMEIDRDVIARAQAVAEREGVDFTAVCRMALFRAALLAEPSPDFDPHRRPPFRPRTKRTRVRFWVPRDPYEEAKQAILAGGRSVAHALEDELRHYTKES
jgi:hypothetical protein